MDTSGSEDINNQQKPTKSEIKSEDPSNNESQKNTVAERVKTSTKSRDRSPDENTTPKRPRLEPGILKPGSSRSSISSIISPTHEQWIFNALLIKVAKGINEDDFKQMKDMYKGGGIPKRTLCDLKKPMDLFDVMRNKMYLSPVDLLQLEGLLWSTKNIDLLNMVIEYAQQSTNVAYLQPASKAPVNGYKHVKFHVKGKNFGEMTKGDLRYLRTVAANTVLIPPSYVIIDGIDPERSVIVTLQFPELHAQILKKDVGRKTSRSSRAFRIWSRFHYNW